MRRILNTFLFIPAFLLFLEGMPHIIGFNTESGSDSSLSSDLNNRSYEEFFLAEAVEESETEENEENESAPATLYLSGSGSYFISGTVRRSSDAAENGVFISRPVTPFHLRAPPLYT